MVSKAQKTPSLLSALLVKVVRGLKRERFEHGIDVNQRPGKDQDKI